MHRGTVFIITKNKDNKFEIQKSTEFNGGMGIENLGGAIYDMLKNFKEPLLFDAMIRDFDERYFKYGDEVMTYSPDEQHNPYIDENGNEYFEYSQTENQFKFFKDDNGEYIYTSDSNYIKNMSDEDIDKAVKEAAEYEAQDKKRKEGIDAKNEADAMVSQTEQAMNEAGDKLDPNDKQEVQADLDALKATIAGIGEEVTDAQIEELKAGKEKLMNSAQKLFAKMYEQTQGAGAQGAGPDMGAQGAGNANDDVVDGEFTEV